ncbi:hypothetical protein KBB05_02265 [Patescibacteria group bacterium]|nr:hypothetical protein [Patescibacteria group bacterium]
MRELMHHRWIVGQQEQSSAIFIKPPYIMKRLKLRRKKRVDSFIVWIIVADDVSYRLMIQDNLRVRVGNLVDSFMDR